MVSTSEATSSSVDVMTEFLPNNFFPPPVSKACITQIQLCFFFFFALMLLLETVADMVTLPHT